MILPHRMTNWRQGRWPPQSTSTSRIFVRVTGSRTTAFGRMEASDGIGGARKFRVTVSRTTAFSSKHNRAGVLNSK
jgi:hypothetical protein